MKRGTTPQATHTLPKGTTGARPRLDRFGGLYAEGAGLEPDPTGWPDVMSVSHPKTPASFTLLPVTLAVKPHCETHEFKLTH